MYEHDERVVMTLDAGGTNFVFSAIRGCVSVVEPVCYRLYLMIWMDACLCW